MAWLNSSWLNRVQVTGLATKIAGDITDYTNAIKFSQLPSAATDNGGVDIRVTESDGTTELPRKVLGTSTIHWKADRSSTVDDDFYIYYSNSGASDYADTDALGGHNAWQSGFILVLPMYEDPSGSAPQMLDLSGGNNDGTSNGTMTSGDSVAGLLDNALDLDGTDDYIELANESAFELSAVFASVMLWFKTSTEQRQVMIGKTGYTNGGDYQWVVEMESDGTIAAFITNTVGTVVVGAQTTASGWDDGAWHQLTILWKTWYDGGHETANLYIDGVEVAHTDTGNPAAINYNNSGPNPVWIGKRTYYNDLEFDGIIDHVLIHTDGTAFLDGNHRNAHIENFTDPSGFYTIGSEETEGGGGGSSAFPLLLLGGS